jgi:AcrR family transcriptional regulator
VTKLQADKVAAELSDTVSHIPYPAASSSLRDARAVKSSQALQAALLALIERKPLEQITIREIAAEAGVHYATFFRHHQTKEALLDRVAAEQIDCLVELTLPVLDRADSHAAVIALCVYVNDHRILWTALLTGGAAGTMREALLRIARDVAVERAPDDGWLPVELAVNCSVSLIFETLAWWLAQEPGAVSIETVAGTLHRLLSSVQQPGGADQPWLQATIASRSS